MNLARALHRLALRAYPSSFRREFQAELERIFDSRANPRLVLYLIC